MSQEELEFDIMLEELLRDELLQDQFISSTGMTFWEKRRRLAWTLHWLLTVPVTMARVLKGVARLSALQYCTLSRVARALNRNYTVSEQLSMPEMQPHYVALW